MAKWNSITNPAKYNSTASIAKINSVAFSYTIYLTVSAPSGSYYYIYPSMRWLMQWTITASSPAPADTWMSLSYNGIEFGGTMLAGTTTTTAVNFFTITGSVYLPTIYWYTVPAGFTATQSNIPSDYVPAS